MPNLYLIGYRGCGKTTVARLLATHLQVEAVDADEYLEQQAGMSINEIFALEGEGGFRDRESAVAAELTKRDRLVVSWGGGVILRGTNRSALVGAGKVVWLRAQPETLLKRIEQDPTTGARRPNLTVAGGIEEIRHLLQMRESLYAGTADWTINVDDLTPEQVVAGILAWLREQGHLQRKAGH